MAHKLYKEFFIMTLPINLVLVRHGQSEGNLAKRLSEAGNDGAYTAEFRNRHSGSFRLTELGRAQAEATGAWLRDEFRRGDSGDPIFDRYFVSEYLRAKETAGLLCLPDASWRTDAYLTERDWGEIDIAPEGERQARFGKALEMRVIEPFFWRPPNGESFMTLCLRVDRVLDTLHRECSDKEVVLVCHGEVMRAFQVRIERLPQERFRELVLSDAPEDRIHNCEVMHYTRRNPYGGRELRPHLDWVRKVRPAEDPFWASKWMSIHRGRYNNAGLLAEAARYPALI